MHKHSMHYICSEFFSEKETQINIHCQTVHLKLVLLPFLCKPLLVPSRRGSSKRATAVQLSYGKRSIIQGQRSYCHPLTRYQAPGMQPAHIHTKHHSFLDTGFLHSLLTGPCCYPSTYITHHPHFSMRACFHIWRRQHQSPEDPSDLLLQPKLEHGIEVVDPNHSRSLCTTADWAETRTALRTGHPHPNPSVTKMLMTASWSATSAPTIVCWCDMAPQ